MTSSKGQHPFRIHTQLLKCRHTHTHFPSIHPSSLCHSAHMHLSYTSCLWADWAECACKRQKNRAATSGRYRLISPCVSLPRMWVCLSNRDACSEWMAVALSWKHVASDFLDSSLTYGSCVCVWMLKGKVQVGHWVFWRASSPCSQLLAEEGLQTSVGLLTVNVFVSEYGLYLAVTNAMLSKMTVLWCHGDSRPCEPFSSWFVPVLVLCPKSWGAAWLKSRAVMLTAALCGLTHPQFLLLLLSPKSSF